MHSPSRLRLVLCGAASLVLLAAGSAQADAAGEATMLLADGSVRISPLTVTGARKDDRLPAIRTTSATKTDTPLRDVPQAIAVIPDEVIKDMAMQSMADVVRYTPGVGAAQGEGNRDQLIIRGQSTTADFFVDGVRDDVQYYRDLYNAERIEVLKGPNAMIFGRGGGGGVINRVTRKANWFDGSEATVEAGSFGGRRATADLNQPVSDNLTVRLTAMGEDSESYRDDVDLQRWGVNPTLSWIANDRLAVTISYEHLSDDRTADRGVPSFNGRPLEVDPSTFFGDPDLSFAISRVDLGSAIINYSNPIGVNVLNHFLIGGYDKFYQNVYAGGAATLDAVGQITVPLAAYNNATQRSNVFNQTDLTYTAFTGPVKHKLLAGLELSRQTSDNFRNTGVFATPSDAFVLLASPTVSAPVIFAQSATDADNHVVAKVAAIYAQDQIELSSQLQLIAGVRFDAFDFDVRNKRNGLDFSRTDHLVSPRLGVVFKPVEPVSLYGSYSVSYLPSSGDQFSSLDVTTENLKPEEFVNYEVGAKWDIRPNLAFTAAVYQLERSNTRFTNPLGTALQTGASRARGFELSLVGNVTEAWQVVTGYAWQDSETTSATGSTSTNTVPAGRKTPLVPRNSLSLWNKYQVTPHWGAGVGVIYQDEVYASTSNLVKLPSFVRVDAAVFWDINERLSAQLNVENLLDEDYFPTSNGDNNIQPGSPRAARVSLTTRF